MDNISRETKFTENRYDWIAQMAIKLGYIMLYYGAGTKSLNMGPYPNSIILIKSDPNCSWAYLNDS